MENFIPSEYYRKYVKKNKIVFSDRERATMLWENSTLPLEKKISEFEKLASETNDGELKCTIESWIEYKNKSIEMAANCRKNEEFYLNSTDLYGTTTETRVFDSFENARKHMTAVSNGKESYMIAKVELSDEKSPKAGAYYECVVEFDRYGEILNAWNYEPFSYGKVGFKFIPFANPFEHGDIVRDRRNGKIGVVETSQDEWNDFLKRNENNKAYDFSDAALIVQFLDDDNFSHSHIQPIYLEKLPLNEKGIPKCFNTKSNFNEYLICFVSRFMNGECSLDTFMSVFLEWREEEIYKEIKSRSWRRC